MFWGLTSGPACTQEKGRSQVLRNPVAAPSWCLQGSGRRRCSVVRVPPEPCRNDVLGPPGKGGWMKSTRRFAWQLPHQRASAWWCQIGGTNPPGEFLCLRKRAAEGPVLHQQVLRQLTRERDHA